MSKYKNILFDADDTIKDFTREDNIILQNIHKNLNLDNTLRCKFLNIIDKIAFMVKNTAILKTNTNTLDIRLKMYAKILNVDLEGYTKEYYKYLSKYIILFAGTKKVINYLKANNYNIFFITNNPTCYKLGMELGFQESNIFVLDGVKKSQAIYNILSKNQLKKEETIMVGDNLLEDIYYAKDNGIDAVWINFEERLYNFFSKVIKPDYIINNIEELITVLE